MGRRSEALKLPIDIREHLDKELRLSAYGNYM